MNKDDLRAMVRSDKHANRYAKLPQAAVDMIRDLAELAAEGDPCSFVFMRREIKAAHGVDIGRQRAERVCADLGVKPWWK